MPIPSGTKLGPYEIVAPLGAGGMGEVYQARDVRLDRTVAIKVLPEAFAQDAERLARFEREAKLLASLNHPNVATLFGFDRAGSTSFLAMEMVAGETLAERIAKGRIPLEEALPLFIQIAQGLEVAHANGVVHRDLKPANIKLTPQGKVKILDFGLAKAFSASVESAKDMATSPTLTAAATLRGEVIGTAAYMSPEQARGKTVDKRTDVWAFGCVLFEALTGWSPFRGETITDTLAAVVRADPDWERIPVEAPASIRRLLRRCLEKDANRRLHDIADARIELEEAIARPNADAATAEGSGPIAVVRTPTRRAMGLALTGTAIAAAALTLLASSFLPRPKPSAPEPARRFMVGSFDLVAQSSPTFSPDGETIVFSATENGTRRIYRRPLREIDAVAIPGTEEGTAPFFSPDGEWVGFVTSRALKRVPLSGGTPLTICNEPDVNSAQWTTDGMIYFTPLAGGVDGQTALARVPEGGGRPERVAEIDRTNGEVECWLPEVLPGDEWVLVTSRHSGDWRIEVIPLKGGARRVLFAPGLMARYVEPDFLVVADLESQATVAIPFDPRRAEIKGTPIPLTEEIHLSNAFAVSGDGKLAYVPSANRTDNVVVSVDRDGKTTPLLETAGPWMQPRLTSSGRYLVLRKIGFPDCDLWLYEGGRHALSRLTREGDCHDPVLSADGRRVAFSRTVSGSQTICFAALDGSGEVESLGPKSAMMRPECWSQDGRIIAATIDGQGTRNDISLVPLDGESEPIPYLHSEYREETPAISPDGKWIAYTSDESGQREVYIRVNPGPGPRFQVSTDGGQGPLWTRGGTEIVFVSGEKMMAATLVPGPEPQIGEPVVLFTGDFIWDRQRDYDVLPDGSRFAMIQRPRGESARKEIMIILNWQAETVGKTQTRSVQARKS